MLLFTHAEMPVWKLGWGDLSVLALCGSLQKKYYMLQGGVENNLHQQPQKKKGGGSANAPHCARSASDRAPFLQMLRMRLELLIFGASD